MGSTSIAMKFSLLLISYLLFSSPMDVLGRRKRRTGMTNPRIVDFDPDFVRFGRGDLNILDR